MTFAEDTAVQRRGEGEFEAQIREEWAIGGNANGGFLMALAARAMAEHSGRPDPLTLTAHFLSPGKMGPVRASCTTLKKGRRFDTIRAALHGAERQILEVLGAFGEVEGDVEAPRLMTLEPPELPPPAECVERDQQVAFAPRPVEVLLHPEDAGWRDGQPSGIARMRGWFRIVETDAVEPIAALFASDGFPPTNFNTRLPVNWTPTVELTFHLRARPAPGWLRGHFTSRAIADGYIEEDGQLWDSQDRLVAQSRQLALLPRPQ